MFQLDPVASPQSAESRSIDLPKKFEIDPADFVLSFLKILMKMSPDDAAILLDQIFVIDSSVACKAFVTLAADTKDDDLDPQSLGLKGDYCRTNPLAWRLTQLLERMGLI